MEAPECCPPEIYEIMRQVNIIFDAINIKMLFIVYFFIGMGFIT